MRNAYGDGAGDVSRFLSPVDDAGEQEKSSDIPGNGSGEEAEDESTKKKSDDDQLFVGDEFKILRLRG